MIHKSKSENFLVSNRQTNPKYQKLGDFKRRLAKVGSVINSLESSILQSIEDDRQLLMVVQRDNLRNQKLTHQLDEARNENKLLLSKLLEDSMISVSCYCNITTAGALQIESDNGDVSKSRSQLDYLSSYSTISMVHLQYKYEELMSSHEGLLKVLESKVRESQKCYRENEELRDEIQKLLMQLSDKEKTISILCDKYLKLKQRKDAKILNLKYEKETLKLAHNQVVNILNERCLLDDEIHCNEPQKSVEPARSLFLKEMKLCNELQRENLRLLQENDILKNQIKKINDKTARDKNLKGGKEKT